MPEPAAGQHFAPVVVNKLQAAAKGQREAEEPSRRIGLLDGQARSRVVSRFLVGFERILPAKARGTVSLARLDMAALTPGQRV